MKLDLTGKRALITAAGGGIGRKTAEMFVDAGASVFMCDIDGDRVEDARAKVDRLDGIVADVSDPTAIEVLFDRAVGHLGGLDILVNNAGTAGPTLPVEEVPLDDWQKCLDINLTSTFPRRSLQFPTSRRRVADQS